MNIFYFVFIFITLCCFQLIKPEAAYFGLEDLENHRYHDYYDYNSHPFFHYDKYDYIPNLAWYHNNHYYDVYDYINDDMNNSFSYDFINNDDNEHTEENDILGLTFKSEDELLSIIKELSENLQNHHGHITDSQEFFVLQRRKRGIRGRSSSSRSRSSSRRRSSSRSSWGFESRKSSSTISKKKDKEKEHKTEKKQENTKSTESAPVDKSSYPKGYYPPINPARESSPSTGYPKASAPPLESFPVDKSSYPKTSYHPTNNAGYPHQPSSGNPNQPSLGYPTQPSQGYQSPPLPGYPQQPSPGYPIKPSPGYPHQPSPGYPNQQFSGYPNQPSPGYPHHPVSGSPGYTIKPSPGYPHQPSPGYPNQVSGYPNQPSPGYPHHPSPGYPNQASYGYPRSGKPSLGIPPLSGAYPGVGYPKTSKKEKIISKVKQAIEGYAMHKMHKKSRGKFISPGMGMGMGLGMHKFHGAGGAMAGLGSMKAGKNILGTIIKLQIAKYALKFGMGAAKAYFEYKLGRSIEERMIEKFISRYHKQRTRNYYRQNRWLYDKKKDFKQENVTLGEDCIRDCKIGGSLTCFYSFHVHLYQYLSRACFNCPNKKEDCEKPECVVGSGRQKLVTVVNRQLPGPTIQVCEGDKILVEVQNELPSSGVALHFRGQSYSEEPFMEGTSGVTSTIVTPGQIFAYKFKADRSGTHFWHATTGVTRSEGIFGALVVKEKGSDPIDQQFDSDLINQTIIISEDFAKRGEEQLVNLFHKKGKIEIYSLLINGKGFKQGESDNQPYSNKIYSEIKVLSGKRNRLRIISGVSSNCPVSFRMKGKVFTVISVDGFPVTPREAQTLLLFPGERIDIVVNDISSGLLWTEVQGFLECENQKQFAVLNSKEKFEWSLRLPNDSKSTENSFSLPAENPLTAFNDMEKLTKSVVYCNNSKIICSRNLHSNLPLPADLKTPPNLTLYLSLTSRPIHNEHFYSLIHYDIASMPVEEQSLTHQINYLTLKVPHEPLLMNQRPLKLAVCSSAGVLRQHCVQNFCECLHLLELPLNKTVDIVFINEGESNSLEPQTMYLHGHNFWVISQNKTFLFSNETLDNSTSPYMDRLRVIIRDAEELIVKNTENPMRMNTITIPEGGYTIIRFRSDNPGFWLLESSSVFRATTGMGLVFKVGEKKDWPEIPKKYLKC